MVKLGSSSSSTSTANMMRLMTSPALQHRQQQQQQQQQRINKSPETSTAVKRNLTPLLHQQQQIQKQLHHLQQQQQQQQHHNFPASPPTYSNVHPHQQQQQQFHHQSPMMQMNNNNNNTIVFHSTPLRGGGGGGVMELPQGWEEAQISQLESKHHQLAQLEKFVREEGMAIEKLTRNQQVLRLAINAVPRTRTRPDSLALGPQLETPRRCGSGNQPHRTGDLRVAPAVAPRQRRRRTSRRSQLAQPFIIIISSSSSNISTRWTGNGLASSRTRSRPSARLPIADPSPRAQFTSESINFFGRLLDRPRRIDGIVVAHEQLVQSAQDAFIVCKQQHLVCCCSFN